MFLTIIIKRFFTLIWGQYSLISCFNFSAKFQLAGNSTGESAKPNEKANKSLIYLLFYLPSRFKA